MWEKAFIGDDGSQFSRKRSERPCGLNSKGLSLCFFELNSPRMRDDFFIVTFCMVSRDGRAYWVTFVFVKVESSRTTHGGKHDYSRKNYKAFWKQDSIKPNSLTSIKENLRILRTEWSRENNPHQYPNWPTKSWRRNDTTPRQRYKRPYPRRLSTYRSRWRFKWLLRKIKSREELNRLREDLRITKQPRRMKSLEQSRTTRK